MGIRANIVDPATDRMYSARISRTGPLRHENRSARPVAAHGRALDGHSTRLHYNVTLSLAGDSAVAWDQGEARCGKAVQSTSFPPYSGRRRRHSARRRVSLADRRRRSRAGCARIRAGHRHRHAAARSLAVGHVLNADPVVQAVLIGLAFASVVTWTVWLAKTIELSAAKRRVRRGAAAARGARARPSEGAERIADADRRGRNDCSARP